MRNRYRGATCVVVTCGPSLGDVPADDLRRALAGHLTIAVKQAVDVVGPQADFQCWNSFNVRRFGVQSTDTIRAFVREPTGRIPQFNRHDLVLPQDNGEGQLVRSIAYRRDFEAYNLTDGLRRPFGPGIMYELVFHLAEHLGVAKIITVGWDIAGPSGKNTHFYDNAAEAAYYERGRAAPGSTGPTRRQRVPEPLRYYGRWAKNARAHRRGETYNRTASLIGESEVVGDSTTDLAAWLAGHRISLAAVTASPHLSPAIERLSVAELFDLLASTDVH